MFKDVKFDLIHSKFNLGFIKLWCFLVCSSIYRYRNGSEATREAYCKFREGKIFAFERDERKRQGSQ